MGNFSTLFGNVVFPDRVEKGCICVENGKIVYAGSRQNAPSAGEVFDFGDRYIAPGFVDIHCHAGGDFWAHENPRQMAAYHLRHGTTGLVCTLYRDVPSEQILQTADQVKALMAEGSNLLGLHLEGPYLNPKYGSGFSGCEKPEVNPSEYLPIAQTAIICQWTFSPEVEGTDGFLRDIVRMGIPAAIGHSAASPEQIKIAEENGARIVTHLFDATGTSVTPTRYGGTIEPSFDCGALLCDRFYYEIICDRGGVHVRPEMLKLAVKTVGIDRIVGITDACTGDTEDNADVNFVDGELMGSKLTMDAVARNFYALGYSVPEVFRVTSLNPAKAIRKDGEIGSLAVGKRADILILDRELNLCSVYQNGEKIENVHH